MRQILFKYYFVSDFKGEESLGIKNPSERIKT